MKIQLNTIVRCSITSVTIVCVYIYINIYVFPHNIFLLLNSSYSTKITAIVVVSKWYIIKLY